MGIRFGFGQYESGDMDVRTSTWEMRCKFLEILTTQKPGWAESLLRLANFELLGPDLEKDHAFHYILAPTFGRDAGGKIRGELLNTPFQHFASFINTHDHQIERWVKKESRASRQLSPSGIRWRAFRSFLPNFRTIEKAGGKALTRSLHEWAGSQNLDREWILDFALSALTGYWALLSDRFANLDVDSIDLRGSTDVVHSSSCDLRFALSKALDDYVNDNVIRPLWNFDEKVSIPEFWFVRDDFKFGPLSWHPLYQTREVFTREAIAKFKGLAGYLKELAESDERRDDRLKSLKRTDFEAELSVFCDRVEGKLPPAYRKTPVRTSFNLHLTWLIDFQVPPTKTHSEIRASMPESRRPTVDAIRKAVGRSAQELGIDPRRPPKSGRPKGARDRGPRNILGV
jgi:hypothetical protein